jgi:hypothetical protein
MLGRRSNAIVALLATALLTGMGFLSEARAQITPPPGFTASELIFDDRFVDLSNWDYGVTNKAANGYPWGATGSAPNYGSGGTPPDFDAEYYYPSQVYQTSAGAPAATPGTYVPNAFSSSGSGLSIKAQAAPTSFDPGNGYTYTWYSGAINTYNHFEFGGNGTHVYLQASIQMPATNVNGTNVCNGSWTGPWMMPGPGASSDAASDDFEFESGYQTNGSGPLMILGVQETMTEYPYTSPSDLAADFHTYGIDWVSGTSLKFYIDGVLISTYTSSVPTNPHIINLAFLVSNSTANYWHCPILYPNQTMTLNVQEVQVYQQGAGPPTQTLTVGETGTGAGQVTSNPAGINCSASSNQCVASLAGGTQVTLTASASAGSSFTGWSGSACSGTGTCQVVLSADTSVTATFKKEPTTKMLSVALSGGGSGAVTSVASGINCGSTCSASFDTGTQIILSAAPANGSTFAGWSGGGCSGIDPCTLTLSVHTAVTASFVANSAGNLTLVAAVLPTSRSVEVGATVTSLATMINAGPTDAATCTIAPASSIPASFLFQTTDPATNALTGIPNTPANIAAGQSQSFVIALTPIAAFAPTNVAFTFACANAPSPAASTVGIDTLELSASTAPVPDIVALVASGDPGYVDIPGATGTGVFAFATINLGSDSTITAAANTGTANLPVTLTLCQTNPTTGACMAAPAPTVTTDIPPNATPTFGVFVTGSDAVADMPGVNRIFVTFTGSRGTLRGETSVAARTQ